MSAAEAMREAAACLAEDRMPVTQCMESTAVVDACADIAAAIRALPLFFPTIPPGMKPWSGGDSPPDDWDGGPVLGDDGEIYEGYGWEHNITWRHGLSKAGIGADIIAYTPKATTAHYLSDRFKWAAPGDQQEDAWIVRFCDNDVRDMLFTGPDAEAEAWAAWERHAPGYNMYVFRLAALRSRPARQDEA